MANQRTARLFLVSRLLWLGELELFDAARSLWRRSLVGRSIPVAEISSAMRAELLAIPALAIVEVPTVLRLWDSRPPFARRWPRLALSTQEKALAGLDLETASAIRRALDAAPRPLVEILSTLDEASLRHSVDLRRAATATARADVLTAHRAALEFAAEQLQKREQRLQAVLPDLD